MEVGAASHPGRITPGKSLRYTLDRRLSGPQTRSGNGSEQEKTPAPAGNREDSTKRKRIPDFTLNPVSKISGPAIAKRTPHLHADDISQQ
jgi:hypothetical protein